MREYKLHVPTDESRAKVKALYSIGVSKERIAKRLNIDPATLDSHYEKELEAALEDMNAELANNVYQRAFESEKLAMYWLNKRAKWEEKPIDNTGAVVTLLEKLIPKQNG